MADKTQFLSPEQLSANRERFISILRENVKRDGLEDLIRDYPEFCVTAKMRCKIELIFQGGSGVGCARLVYNITPTGAEVKGHPRPLGSRRRRSAP